MEKVKEETVPAVAEQTEVKARPPIPPKVLRRLWVNSGGRCEYDGCNTSLLEHALLKHQFNIAYVAHIVAAKPDGARGHETRSFELATDYDNLMLLCDACHRLVDEEDVDGHPVERLTEMKKKHEARIQLVTDIKPQRNTHIVLYGANIGVHASPLSYAQAAESVLPQMFPAKSHALELSLGNCAFEDHTPEYWAFQVENLVRRFRDNVLPIIEGTAEAHFSVFALAPMPLLIKLGTLLPDLYRVDVYQRQREPQTWKWQETGAPLNYRLEEPADKNGVPVLVISVSATITDDRVAAVIPDNHSIWRITVDVPGNDCMKTKANLAAFRAIARQALDVIKAEHGQNTPLLVFPAMPVSAAVEFGRIRMPKADMSMAIYDQNRHANSFIQTITIQ